MHAQAIYAIQNINPCRTSLRSGKIEPEGPPKYEGRGICYIVMTNNMKRQQTGESS